MCNMQTVSYEIDPRDSNYANRFYGKKLGSKGKMGGKT